MYSDKNLKKVKENIKDIEEKAEIVFRKNHFEPSLKEVQEVNEIIIKFLKNLLQFLRFLVKVLLVEFYMKYAYVDKEIRKFIPKNS